MLAVQNLFPFVISTVAKEKYLTAKLMVMISYSQISMGFFLINDRNDS